MTTVEASFDNKVPRVLPVRSGGYFALSPEHDPLRIGVEALTEDDALRLYAEARASWSEILSRP